MIINHVVGVSIKLLNRNIIWENKGNHRDRRLFFIKSFFSLKENQYPNSLALGHTVPCVLVSHKSDRVSAEGVGRFDACIGLSCRLLMHKCIGRTIKRGGITNVELPACVDFTPTLWNSLRCEEVIQNTNVYSAKQKKGLVFHKPLIAQVTVRQVLY
jgi:hypothetical protein